MRRKRKRRRPWINSQAQQQVVPRKRRKIHTSDDVDSDDDSDLGGVGRNNQQSFENISLNNNEWGGERERERGGREEQQTGREEQSFRISGPEVVDRNFNNDYLFSGDLLGNDDDEDDVQIIPISPPNCENSECDICNSELTFSGTTKLSEDIHKDCSKIIDFGIKTRRIKKAVSNATDYVNKLIIEPHNEFKNEYNDRSIEKLKPWNKKVVEQHYTKCLSTFQTRSEDALSKIIKMANDLYNYDAYYKKNDGPVDPETGKKTFITHCRPPVIKLAASLLKEAINLDAKCTRLYNLNRSRCNKVVNFVL